MRWLGLFLLLLIACGEKEPADRIAVPGRDGEKTIAALRAERRAFDGAPPVIPHERFPSGCENCHQERGMAVEGVGFSPPSPHVGTRAEGSTQRCRQCHVYAQTEELFRDNSFAGIRQDLRKGSRLYDGAPPVMPHMTLMRENCRACHSGPAAREEIRTSHPERERCRQCHVPVMVEEVFRREG